MQFSEHCIAVISTNTSTTLKSWSGSAGSSASGWALTTHAAAAPAHVHHASHSHWRHSSHTARRRRSHTLRHRTHATRHQHRHHFRRWLHVTLCAHLRTGRQRWWRWPESGPTRQFVRWFIAILRRTGRRRQQWPTIMHVTSGPTMLSFTSITVIHALSEANNTQVST